MQHDPIKPARGGRRPGAGRKKTGKRIGGPHRRRPELSYKHPVHVVLRCVKGVPRLRKHCMYRAIRRGLLRSMGKPWFRVVHISIQKDHLHLIAEAADRDALTRGMQSLTINVARAINAGWGRGGKVFAYRYHASQIRTGSYTRNALSYVLNNWRRHREDFFDGAARSAKLDEYSSAVSFTGWARSHRWKLPADYEPLPVESAQTALLRSEWRRHGLIAWSERPGPLW